MKPDPTVRNRLRAARAHAGLSQQEVALAAGVSRQTISGLESGAAAPSAGVALRLARVFGCRLEDLFWLEDALAVVTAAEAGPRPAEIPFRVSLAPSGDGGWIAAPLQGERAFRTELTPCDGLAVPDEAGRGLQVTPLEDPETLQGTLFLAGCTPVLSLWARAAERWRAGLRAHWQFANSSDALHALARGWIHLAAIHLPESDDGPSTPELVRQACGDRPVVLVRLGVWEEGLLVASGNPRSLAGVADLAQDGIRIVNREPGSGSRQLLEQELARAGIPGAAVEGYQDETASPESAARQVVAGRADAAMSSACLATAFGLGFVPLRAVPYDLVLRESDLMHPPVQQLLGTLEHRWLRSQFQALGGCDTTETGTIVARVG